MSLAPGTHVGPYEIVAAIGAGGMGEVYRAIDTKLDRPVAIKTLPSVLAQEPDRLARFEREAKLLATLNHAYIGAIYGLDEHEGAQFIAMELIDGETLEEKLKDGALSVEEGLRIALQITEALEAAHDKGVVHRDLKPANIMLTQDGVVKVLDFGLAKAFSGTPNEASPAHSPALSLAMTQQGLILGTAGYMSPEQASGQATDQRADIWAFGVVLYEMLTGLPLFSGESVPHVLAAVLQTEPDWVRLPKNLHPDVQRALQRCLTKKPRDRYHSIADARVDIESALRDPAGVTPRRAVLPEGESVSAFMRIGVPTGVAVIAAAVAGLLVWLGNRPEPQFIDRFYHQLERGQTFRFAGWNVLAIASNGRSIAYNASDGIYVRRLDELEGRRVPGTDMPIASVEFSPDGQSLLFGNAATVAAERISINGGASVFVADINSAGDTTWGPDGILFSQPEGIYRVPLNGGPPELVITVGTGERVGAATLLPDGDTMLFSVTDTPGWDDAFVVGQSLATGERRVFVEGGSAPRYLPTGHLLYALGEDLFGVAFDVDNLTVEGAAVSLVQGLLRGTGSDTANYGVSEDGTLAYVTGTIAADARRLLWVDRDGRETPIDAPARAYTSPRISPDGSKVAVNARDEELDIWVWEFERETLMRLSFNTGQDRFPAWSPDGTLIAYSAPSLTAGAGYDIVLHAADGTGTPNRIVGAGGQNFPETFVPDGSAILVRDDSGGGDDIALVPLDGASDSTSILSTAYSETAAELSPDGRWLAYVSDESGRNEIYVRPFPDVDAGRWQVSTGGGAEPLWSRDGGELFYRNGDALVAVNVETETSFTASGVRTLFQGEHFVGVGQGGRSYDVSLDGERFLMIQSIADEADAPRIVIVKNWIEELQRLVPTD